MPKAMLQCHFRVMRKIILLVIGVATSNTVIANPHKCEINGHIIFQDAPCRGEIEKNTDRQESESRELFDKVFIGQMKVSKGKEREEYTPLNFEVTATNNTQNKIQLTLKYDGLDNDGLVIDTQNLTGSIDNNSSKKIIAGKFLPSRRTALVNKIVKWRFNSWKSTIN